MVPVIVVGGGLAGLSASILLKREGLEVLLIEKYQYPFHRVCGEYISNETKPFLQYQGLYPDHLGPSEINQFLLTDVNGKGAYLDLPLGGFGISRYSLDQYWYEVAKHEGVKVLSGKTVTDTKFSDNKFTVTLNDGKKLEASIVLGCFGKRSLLDRNMKRRFMNLRSPYMGIKFHMKTNHEANTVALHNFKGGYCGVSNVEKGITNFCYLIHRDAFKAFENIETLEEQLLGQNPKLEVLLREGEKLFENPLVINEISFERKLPVEDHIIMAGDSAGLITPLCGNGMAMAIHGAVIASELICKYFQDQHYTREDLEKEYTKRWNHTFAFRLKAGRNLQKLFGSTMTSSLAVNFGRKTPFIARKLIKLTHGKPFEYHQPILST